MDRLERYLDQVCRGIGGPRSLRQHVRQELREHLLDAVADHQAAGLPADEALDRALEDFGGPEQVRSELEATHGHRLMAVVIDKAMQWKETTMKAKWLWSSWAHLAVAGVIGLEVLFITFAAWFLVPKFQHIVQHVGYNLAAEPGVAWVPGFFRGLDWVAQMGPWLLALVAGAWGLFEWRVQSEHKSLIRLSALGTASLGLMVVVALMAAGMIISLSLLQPKLLAQIPERVPAEQAAEIDAAVRRLEQAIDKKDWEAMKKQAGLAAAAVRSLEGQVRRKETRTQLKAAHESLSEAGASTEKKDLEKVKAALAKFREAYGPIAKAAVKPDE